MTGFGRILDDLNGAGVRYVLIEGIALIRHGVVRATRDVDAVFDPNPSNVERIRTLVERWGATRPDGSPIPEGSIVGNRTIHLATPHGELDLLAQNVAAVGFSDLLARAETRRVDGVEAPIWSLAEAHRGPRARPSRSGRSRSGSWRASRQSRSRSLRADART